MKNSFLAVCLGFSATLQAGILPTNSELEQRSSQSETYLLANISPDGAAQGAVVASPSRSNPDYFYHWIRDGALVMDVVRQLAKNSTDPSNYNEMISDFATFSRQNQLSDTPSGLGEPKFYANGDVFSDPWGRPQNDGPALRALTLGRSVLERFVPGQLIPELDVIERDLNYVAANWDKASFDLWEEVKGDHFYTRMVQVAALELGVGLFQTLENTERATYYASELNKARQTLAQFWDEGRGILVVTRNRNGGLDYKSSGLDSANILAINHVATPGQKEFGHTDSRVLSTFIETVETFARVYSINHRGGPGTAIGRYPEDVYDGVGFGGGNPWFLTTLGYAEFMYKLAQSYLIQGEIKIDSTNLKFFNRLGYKLPAGTVIEPESVFYKEILNRVTVLGDSFVSRAAYHAGDNNRMFEQMNRNSGFMQGAPDLTWSYAAHVSAAISRRALLAEAENKLAE